MHIGLGLQFANLDNKVTDDEVYRRELDLAARAEDVGFDSVFVSEHHFSDYQLTSEQMMVLSWIAARTTRIKLGTFVTVLPWHDPVRVAESFLVLDHLSDGRAMLGLGRGLGRVEFDGFRLRDGRVAPPLHRVHRGDPRGARDRLHRVRRRALPAAAHADPPATRWRRSRAARSRRRCRPQSMELMAKLGVGIMVIAQKPWDDRRWRSSQAYRERFVELNGAEPPKPILVVVAGVSKDPDEVEADARGLPAALGPLDGRALRVRQRRLRRDRGLRVLQRPRQQHRQARPRPVQRLPRRPPGAGARPTRSPRSCSST